MNVYEQAARFVRPLIPENISNATRPFVTLTYAQSLDGKIAGLNGRQLILSGQESMIMTHRLRTVHDAIMVGIGTVLNDDPRLSARLVDPSDPTPPHQPQPIVLDAHLRFPLTAKLLQNFRSGTGKAPWIVTAVIDDTNQEKKARQKALEEAGAMIVIGPMLDAGYFSLPSLLTLLYHRGIATLMIEGGAHVIQSCLETPGSVDLLIITVAPNFVGRNSVTATGEEGDVRTPATTVPAFPKLDNVRYEQFGRDIVMTARPVWD